MTFMPAFKIGVWNAWILMLYFPTIQAWNTMVLYWFTYDCLAELGVYH